MSASKLHAIDTLRGLAAVQVIAFHLATMPNTRLATDPWSRPFIEHGNSGVTLFFLISAFTLALSMKTRTGEKRPLLSFGLRRLFRIVPLFFFWLAWMLIRYRHDHIPIWPDIIASLTFIYNFIPGKSEGIVWASWTLGVEMVFYLFFPFLFRMCGTFVRSLVFFVLSVAVSFLCREMIYRSGLSIDVASSFYNTSLSRHLPSFAAGLMIFHIYRNYIREKEVSRWIGLAGIAAACVAYSFWVNSSLSPLWDIVAMDIIYGALALGLIIAPLGLVVNRVTRFIGEISYSIYLGHVPVISVLPILGMIYAASFPIAGKFFVSFVAITAATILLSVGTYYLIEKPGMLLGKKLIEILNRGSPRSKRQSVTVSLDVSDKSAT